MVQAGAPVAGASVQAEAQAYRRTSELAMFWEALRRDKLSIASAVVIGMVALAALFAPWISPYDPNFADSALRLKPIGTAGHILGLDGQGRDILSRLIWGGRVSLATGIVPVAIAGLLSILLGLIAGYLGGKTDAVIMRTLDVFFAFPQVLLGIAIAGFLGPGMMNVMISIGVVLSPWITRVAYTAVRSAKGQQYVEMAKACGANQWQIMFIHILPNCLSPVIVYSTTIVSVMIVLGAGFSFLGLGVQPPTADWGVMISDGRTYLSNAPHVSVVPGILLVTVSMAFNLLGDGFRDALDPRLRR
jgi:ABC-type dipeptide/oligopeptide/nickel transport system permease subunit